MSSLNKLHHADVKEKISVFLNRSTRLDDLDPDADIFELGIVHSLFVMQIVLFIEKQFGIELEPDELEQEQLGSVNKISSVVLSQLNKTDLNGVVNNVG